MVHALRTAARQLVYDLFQTGLAAVQGQHCVADYLSHNPLRRPVSLVATGKAAFATTRGAIKVIDRQLVNGLVITKTGHGDGQLEQDPRLHCIVSGHPVPNHASLLAGDVLCRFLEAVPDKHDLLFLISGGTSSLVEVLRDSIQLDDLVHANQWLLGSGMSINEINQVRQSLSLIKGGGLLTCVNDRSTTVLLISDVPGDDPGVIGSGLLYPSKPSIKMASLPDWLDQIASPIAMSRDIPDTVKHHIIATNTMALQAAADKGRARGYAVKVSSEPLAGDAQRAGQVIASQLHDAPDGIYLWGGETTVTLPETTGEGGRNQHLALSAAQALSSDDDIVLLAAGTDGTDGPTDAAGAIVDTSTLGRGQAKGLDACTCLQRADSGRFLAATGDLLQTGPTGTNVMDIVIAVKGNYTKIKQSDSGNIS